MASSTICVLDSCVCIDLHAGRLVEVMQLLPFRFVLPDLIWHELSEPKDLMKSWSFSTVTSLTKDQVSKIFNSKQDKQCIKLTVNDIAAFILAKDLDAILLTNDQELRRLAETENVICHGVLWILDILVGNGLSQSSAAEALSNIISNGSWLPIYECRKRLARWKQ